MNPFSSMLDSDPVESLETKYSDYPETREGFKEYLHTIGNELFPFPGFRDYQDEILYETLDAFFIDSYENVIIEGPTGIGKSPFNVAVGRVVTALNQRQAELRDHFGVSFDGLRTGKSFYTTPQKQLRNQLAEDEDLMNHVSMLKSRRDYYCEEGGTNCADCPVRSSPEESCREKAGCNYWRAKAKAMEDGIGVITFAMLIVDNYVPVRIESGEQISFDRRDLVIVDEGHNAEGQASSLFAGFTLSPWSLPEYIYGDAGDRVNWEADRLEDVRELVVEIKGRASNFIDQYEDVEEKQSQVEDCEDILRKMEYCLRTADEGRGWVVNVNEVRVPGTKNDMTKAIELKPVRVDDFLANFVWSRGRRRLITSATIPFRGNIKQWEARLGLPGRTKFISKPTPFPVQHRQIHLNTMVGEMSGDGEEENWDEAIEMIEEIQSHHDGEKGLIHSVSYPRAKEIGEALGEENCIIHEEEYDQDAIITRWQNSDKDILVSPTMMQGTDLYEDRCRWQVLFKVPYAYMGDSRVSYLLYEENEWQWYMENAAMNIIQAVGRAVRGPEPEEAASFYVIDKKFDTVMSRTNPPDYFVEAITDEKPTHWDFPKTAPWR
jgi:Rad3-related DNA helicase